MCACSVHTIIKEDNAFGEQYMGGIKGEQQYCIYSANVWSFQIPLQIKNSIWFIVLTQKETKKFAKKSDKIKWKITLQKNKKGTSKKSQNLCLFFKSKILFKNSHQNFPGPHAIWLLLKHNKAIFPKIPWEYQKLC